MGRKRKEEPKKEEQMVLTQTYVELDMVKLKEDARQWAVECGLKEPFVIDEPVKEPFPKFGHGYSIRINEMKGKERMATARYTHAGKRSYWSVDGLVTG